MMKIGVQREIEIEIERETRKKWKKVDINLKEVT